MLIIDIVIYRRRYEGVIGVLCDSLASLDEAEAKASVVWILGEYAHRIENAADLLEGFVDTFPEESPEVLFDCYKLPFDSVGYDSFYNPIENTVDPKPNSRASCHYHVHPVIVTESCGDGLRSSCSWCQLR